MDESYSWFASFAQTWGLVIFFVGFMGVLAYVFWPSNKKGFDEAAQIPLEEDDSREHDS